MAVIALICAHMSAQEVQPEVTLDFTSNDTWKIPVKDAMGTTEQTFTNGTYSIKLAAPDGYYYNTKDKFLMLGKKGATLTLPAFTFPVSRCRLLVQKMLLERLSRTSSLVRARLAQRL